MNSLLLRTVRRVAGLIVLILFASPVISSGQEPGSRSRSDASASQDMQAASTALDLQRVYSRMFADRSASELESFKANESNGIVLQAAWENVRRKMNAPVPPANQLIPAPAIDAQSAQRFLGVVEGRSRVTLPSWWEYLVTNAQYRNRTMLVWPGNRMEQGQKLTLRKSLSDRWVVPSNISRIDDTGQMRVIEIQSGVKYSIPKEVLSELEVDQAECVSFLAVDDTKCAVAFHSNHTGHFNIYVIEKGKLNWKSEVWTGVPPVASESGIGYNHFVEFKLSPSRQLIVFGATTFVVYVEGFSLADGKCEFRFSSSY